jgi:hypothetical protein
MLTFLRNIDVEPLISAFQFLKEENDFAYDFIIATPHVFLENVGIRRAILIVKAMKKYVMPFLLNIDIQQDDQYPENSFATYCYTAAKAFGTYNSNMQTDVEMVANYIRTIVDWQLKEFDTTMKYPETAGSIMNANEGAKCYRLLTLRQVTTLVSRINGQALHNCTMLSEELLDSLRESYDSDDTYNDIPFYGLESHLPNTTESEIWSEVSVDQEIILKVVNVGTNPRTIHERLQKLSSPKGIITDRTLEVTTAAIISTTLTLTLIVASSMEIQLFRDNGIDITSLWSLWTIVLALCVNMFIATVTTDWNWYYFLRLKSLEKSIGPRHLEMIDCCKHDFLYALSGGHLKDIFKVVNKDTSFIRDELRGGDIALNLDYTIEDLELATANIWKHNSGGYRMRESRNYKSLVPMDTEGNTAHFSANDRNQLRFCGKHKVMVTRVK